MRLQTHGAGVLRAHGAFLRDETWLGLLGGATGKAGCGQVTAYADPDEHTHRDRCVVQGSNSGHLSPLVALSNGPGLAPWTHHAPRRRATARNFLLGLLPECFDNCAGFDCPTAAAAPLIKFGHELRPVFNCGADSHFGGGALPPGCPGMPPQPVVDGGILGGSIESFTAAPAQAALIQSLGEAVGCCSTELCARTERPPDSGSTDCSLLDIGQQSFNPGNYWSLYNGTLSVAASVAEYLQLLYLNNMETVAVAPGLSEAGIGRLTQLHQLNMQVSSGTPWVAQVSKTLMMTDESPPSDSPRASTRILSKTVPFLAACLPLPAELRLGPAGPRGGDGGAADRRAGGAGGRRAAVPTGGQAGVLRWPRHQHLLPAGVRWRDLSLTSLEF
eukprot:SAG22_NODE_1144_length_5376_cov_4.815994_3_plen_388_part_00